MTDYPSKVYDSPEEQAARALLEILYPDTYSKRWNVEVTKNGITFCDGFHDKGEECSHDVISIKRESAAIYRHKKRGSLYQDLGDGVLQLEDGATLTDGDQLKVYIDSMDRLWFRKPSEFHDGRFEKIKEFSNGDEQEDKVEVTPLGIVTYTPGSETLRQLVKETMERFNALPKEIRDKMWEEQRRNFDKGPFGPTDGMGTVVIHSPITVEDGKSILDYISGKSVPKIGGL